MSPRPRSSAPVLIGALLVAALAAFAYREAITSDFTGGDTIALIEVSRVKSFGDLVKVWTQPMLPILTLFYRPVANFSYTIDHWIWGMDARGFHITDVVVHAITSALVVVLVWRWSKHGLAATLAGLSFALHPILMETVPNPTRRQDMLGGMFMLLALCSLPDFKARKPRFVHWIPSLVACALALGAKEGSVVFPALVFAWAMLVGSVDAPGKPRWKSALRIAAPFAALTIAFVAVRAVILGGAGGNEASWKWTASSMLANLENIADYFDDLVYPLRAIFHPYLSGTDRAIAIAAAIGFCCMVPAMFRWWKSTQAGSKGLFALGMLALGAVLFFPAISAWLRGVIEQAYRNEAWPSVAAMIDSPRKQPVELYVWKAFDLGRVLASGGLILLGVLLSLLWFRARKLRPARSEESGWMVFCLLWMGLHLSLFLAVQRYHAWNAYVPAIPFCCLLGLGVARSGEHARVKTGGAILLMLFLAAFSPLVRSLEVWKANGTFNSMLMAEIARIAREAPAGTTLEFRELPNHNFSWHTNGPEPVSVYTLNAACTISLAKIEAPEKDLRVVVVSQKPVREPFASIRLVSETLEDRRVVVRAKITSAP
ncbi:MAG: hypothetical protein ABI054_04365 [Planctomycetota bacterium]